MNRIYLDNAATTPLNDEVLREMMPFLTGRFGNAGSIHETGRDARKAVEDARRKVAASINCSPQEVYLTSGGTESDNWAIIGAAFANQGKGKHIVSSAVEHHAVLYTLGWLEKQGFEVTILPVDKLGRVDPEAVRSAVRDDTILITVMAANNEIGTIQPVHRIAEISKERGILLHTDAVQAVGAIPVDVQAWGVDMLSLSAHKFHGPKGVGALYIRRGARVDSLLHGGAQERNRRAGTENVPGIVGLGAAIKRACQLQPENARRIAQLRDELIFSIMDSVPDARLNGDSSDRLPNNINLSFKGVEGEALLLRLDLEGVAASSGSACTSGSLDPSHVLMAIGLQRDIAHSSLRLTLSEETTREEVNEVKNLLPCIVRTLREMSPLFHAVEQAAHPAKAADDEEKTRSLNA